jgi:acyl-CoA hydrolase
MKLADEAGAIAATRHASRPVVTVAVDSMTFQSPVNIGNLLQVSAAVTWTGRTSIETRVSITAEDVLDGTVTNTNKAFFVYVALDKFSRPAPVPPLIYETEEEKRRFEEGAARQAYRLSQRQ